MPQPLHLIIVDDESFMRDNLAHLFPWEELGYEVASVFANGREALAYLEHNPADVVLTDIQMPVMDGLELARCIREQNIPARLVFCPPTRISSTPERASSTAPTTTWSSRSATRNWSICSPG